MSPESVGTLARRGFAWNLLASGAIQAITIGATIVLARYVLPREFGVYAATLLFTEVASTLVSSGFVSVLIQRQEVGEPEYGTTFIASLALAVCLAALMVAAAPWVGAYFHEPQVGAVLSLLSVSILVLPFTSIPSAMLRRELRFRVLASSDIYAAALNSIAAIVLALLHFGVWSLVWSRILANVFRAVYVSIAAGWLPQWTFQPAILRRLLPGIGLFASKNVLNDVASNVPYTLVGKLLGADALGFYSRAYSLMALPLTKLSATFGVVLFPAFSQIRTDMDHLREFLLKSACGLSLLAFPAIVGLLVTARVFVPVVLGPTWNPAIAPLEILCLAGLIYALEPVVISALHGTGYVSQEVLRQVLYLVLLVVGVSVSARFGITGVSVAVLAVAVIHIAMLLVLTRRVLALPWGRLWESVKPALVFTAVMAAAVMGARIVLLRWMPVSPAMLAVLILTGMAVYALLLFRFPPVSRDPVPVEILGALRARAGRYAGGVVSLGGRLRKSA